MAWDLVNVEALPHAVLMNGVSWEWESFPEYMSAIERHGIALNTAFLVPLSALRFYVMGEEAAQRAATAEETAQMAALFRDAMIAGAYGFSLSLAPQHIGFQGRPLASRMASREELGALCRVMRELNRGIIEILPSRGGASISPSDGGFELLVFLAEQSRRPLTFLAILDLPGTPLKAHEETIERLKPLLARGLQDFSAGHARVRSSNITRCAIRLFSPRSIRGRACSIAAPRSKRRSFVPPSSARRSKPNCAREHRRRYFAAAGIAFTWSGRRKAENQRFLNMSIADTRGDVAQGSRGCVARPRPRRRSWRWGSRFL